MRLLCLISMIRFGRALMTRRFIIIIIIMCSRIMFFLSTRDNSNNNSNNNSSSTIMNSARVLYPQLHSRMQARQVSNFIPHLRHHAHPRHDSILLIGQGVVGYDPILSSLTPHTHIQLFVFVSFLPMRNYFICFARPVSILPYCILSLLSVKYVQHIALSHLH